MKERTGGRRRESRGVVDIEADCASALSGHCSPRDPR